MKPSENENTKPSIAMFAVLREDGLFFGGFDPVKREATFVDSVFTAKLFTDKFGINLRADERMVEVRITLDESNVSISNPFRPRRRTSSQVTQASVR